MRSLASLLAIAEASHAERRNVCRGLRQHQTASEATLWYALRSRRFDGYKFRRQHPIAGHVADFACIAAKLVIEIDGETHFTSFERRRD
ncbi:MAG: DUF559 domain-containing protein [Phreatobacter sp.]|nr:DUF559 domain-containing protein [Phreatobacter sp.]